MEAIWKLAIYKNLFGFFLFIFCFSVTSVYIGGLTSAIKSFNVSKDIIDYDKLDKLIEIEKEKENT